MVVSNYWLDRENISLMKKNTTHTTNFWVLILLGVWVGLFHLFTGRNKPTQTGVKCSYPKYQQDIPTFKKNKTRHMSRKEAFGFVFFQGSSINGTHFEGDHTWCSLGPACTDSRPSVWVQISALNGLFVVVFGPQISHPNGGFRYYILVIFKDFPQTSRAFFRLVS